MRIVILLFVPIVLIFICALILLWLPLPKPFPPALSQGRNIVVAILVGILGLGYLIGLIVYVGWLPLQAARALDPALEPAGFTSRNYMLFGRQHTGTYRDRAFDVQYFPPQRGRAGSLNVTLDAATGMRMAVGEQQPLLDCRDCAPLVLDGTELAGLVAFAENQPRARNLVADPAAQTSLNRLVRGRPAPDSGQVYVQPTRVWFRVYPRQLSTDQVWQWFDDLVVVAHAAEQASD